MKPHLPLTLLLCAALTGCGVVSGTVAVVGAAASVTGAVVSTAVSVTGAVVETTVRAVGPSDKDDQAQKK
jgi:hypothetical protein